MRRKHQASRKHQGTVFYSDKTYNESRLFGKRRHNHITPQIMKSKKQEQNRKEEKPEKKPKDEEKAENLQETMDQEQRDLMMALELQKEEMCEEDPQSSPTWISSHLDENKIIWSSHPEVNRMIIFFVS